MRKTKILDVVVIPISLIMFFLGCDNKEMESREGTESGNEEMESRERTESGTKEMEIHEEAESEKEEKNKITENDRSNKNNLKKLYKEEGNFSFKIPKNWFIKKVQGIKYKVAYTTARDGFAPNINILEKKYGGSSESYFNISKESVKKKWKVLEEGDFSTYSSLKAKKIKYQSLQQGVKMQQIAYIFEGRNHKILIVTCTDLAKDANKLEKTFNNIMKTFEIHKE